MCFEFHSGREFTTLRLHHVKFFLLYNVVGGFFVGILDFIFPKRCLSCGRFGKYFCDRCRRTIKLIAANEAICPVCEKPAVDGATHPHCQTRYTPDGLTSFFRYDGIVRIAIKAIKYRYLSDLAKEFTDLIPLSSLKTLSIYHELAVFLPIPLHPARFRERGFNQAEVLGKLIAGRLGIPMNTKYLKRIKKTIPQVQMKDRQERLKNMEKVFAVNTLLNNTGSSVILFDDVFTTGATMRSATNVLKRVGVKNVWGVTMAR